HDGNCDAENRTTHKQRVAWAGPHRNPNARSADQDAARAQQSRPEARSKCLFPHNSDGPQAGEHRPHPDSGRPARKAGAQAETSLCLLDGRRTPQERKGATRFRRRLFVGGSSPSSHNGAPACSCHCATSMRILDTVSVSAGMACRISIKLDMRLSPAWMNRRLRSRKSRSESLATESQCGIQREVLLHRLPVMVIMRMAEVRFEIFWLYRLWGNSYPVPSMWYVNKTFNQAQIESLSPKGFTVRSSGGVVRIEKYGCGAELRKSSDGRFQMTVIPSIMAQGQFTHLWDAGYQKFLLTHDGAKIPIRVTQLGDLRRFNEELRTALG